MNRMSSILIILGIAFFIIGLSMVKGVDIRTNSMRVKAYEDEIIRINLTEKME